LARPEIVQQLVARLPLPLKRLSRRLLGRSEPVVRQRGCGVIEDLCYWVADERLDTVLPLQNYCSILFPTLDTTTRGTLHLFDAGGRALGSHRFDVPAHAIVKLRVSDMLRAAGAPQGTGFGTLLCDIAIPPAVLAVLAAEQPFYFWDRFYISYVPRGGAPCFVHGVDKTYVAHADDRGMQPFYPSGKSYRWVPEIPVDLTQYQRFSVAIVNRTEHAARVTLTVTDAADRTHVTVASVAPRGAHRFALTSDTVAGLDARDLRLCVDGIPTRWGRPVVFKEFANGAVSAMHC